MIRNDKEYQEIANKFKDDPYQKEIIVLTAYGDHLAFTDILGRQVDGINAVRIHLVKKHKWSTHDAQTVPDDFLLAYLSQEMEGWKMPQSVNLLLA